MQKQVLQDTSNIAVGIEVAGVQLEGYVACKCMSFDLRISKDSRFVHEAIYYLNRRLVGQVGLVFIYFNA